MMSKFTPQDRIFMRKALNLAAKAQGLTSPNPMVGAVVVRNGKIIAQGFHLQAGKAHAEVEALQKLSLSQLRGAILYVTLEPCNHFGRTSPCTNFLINSGIKHIIVAMRDPNHLVKGRGIAKLRKAGIKVEIGLLENDALRLNEAYVHALQTGRVFVNLKMASSLDGRIATSSGDSKWITNEKSRKFVHGLRSKIEGILTTAKTVLADNPHLGVRMLKGKDPLRIILDRKLETSLDAQVYRDLNVLVITTKSASLLKLRQFEKAGVSMIVFPSKDISLKLLFADLHKRGLNQILVEAGSGLNTAILKEKLAQKFYFFIAPKIIGEGLNVVGNLDVKEIAYANLLKNVSIRHFDNDVLYIGYL